jgi:hypothetical protein
MTIDEAIAILRVTDMRSHARFSAEEREAIQTLGAAGWSGQLEPSDPRVAALPKEIRKAVEDLVAIMQTKRVIQ